MNSEYVLVMSCYEKVNELTGSINAGNFVTRSGIVQWYSAELRSG
jgi:hypothetical protein